MQSLMYQVFFYLGLIALFLQRLDLTEVSTLLKLDLVNDFIYGLPTQLIDHQVSELSPEEDREFLVHGYWENYNLAIHPGAKQSSNATYYSNDLKDVDLVEYAFLALDQKPDPSNPHNVYWNGTCIHDTMTGHCVASVVNFTAGWRNPDNWQAQKVEAMLNYTQNHTKKFIWAIGGASDVRLGLNMSQIDNFTRDVVDLLSVAGDGIVMDFEHLSDTRETKHKQLTTMAMTLLKTREALDKAGLNNKTIGYTTRYNSFWLKEKGNLPKGYAAYLTDGECLIMDEILKSNNSSLSQVLDYVSLMIYDIAPPSSINEGPDGLKLSNYKIILKETEKVMPRNKIVVGFEPGAQWGGAKWEGLDEDKEIIDYVKLSGYRGIMFWSVNQPGDVGINTAKLAKYAKQN